MRDNFDTVVATQQPRTIPHRERILALTRRITAVATVANDEADGLDDATLEALRKRLVQLQDERECLLTAAAEQELATDILNANATSCAASASDGATMSADNVLVIVQLENGTYLGFDESFSFFSRFQLATRIHDWVASYAADNWRHLQPPVLWAQAAKKMAELVERYLENNIVEYDDDWYDDQLIYIPEHIALGWLRKAEMTKGD